jgi:hypothetical protein
MTIGQKIYQNKIIFNFVIFYKKKLRIFFNPLFCCSFWIRDPGWIKIMIWDKHWFRDYLAVVAVQRDRLSHDQGRERAQRGRRTLAAAQGLCQTLSHPPSGQTGQWGGGVIDRCSLKGLGHEKN